MRLTPEGKITVYSILFYSFWLLVHYVYTVIINPSFLTIIADQWIFHIRGSGFISGLIPYIDFSNAGGPIIFLFWSAVVCATDFADSTHYHYSDTFSYAIRILFFFFILFSTIMLYRIERRKRPDKAFIVAMLYGFNPFFVILISFWGSDELVVPLIFLLPFYLYYRKNNTLATLSILLGTAIKFWPILLLPIIWIYAKSWTERIIQTSIFFGTAFAVILPIFLSYPDIFLRQINRPVAKFGDHGYHLLIEYLTQSNLDSYRMLFTLITVSLLGLVGLYLFLTRKSWDYYRASTLCFVYLLTFQKFQVSYVVMFYPFLIPLVIHGTKWQRWYIIVTYIVTLAMGEMVQNIVYNGLSSFEFFYHLLFYFLAYLLMILLFFMLLKPRKEDSLMIQFKALLNSKRIRTV